MNFSLGNLLALLAALSTAFGPIQEAVMAAFAQGQLFVTAVIAAWTIIVAQVAPFFKKKDE